MATKKYQKARKKIPAAIQRVVKVEARHSCIVCKVINALELHHIDGDRENNNSENIACICANCHTRAENGEITRLELKQYKEKAQEEDETIRKLKQELAYYGRGTSTISVSQSFNQIKIKYENILRDFSDKMIFYQSFIYLASPFFLDQRGDRTREIIRELLGVNLEEEKTILSHLRSAGLLDITGELASLKDKTDAKVALNELIDTGRIDLDKTIHLFVNI